MTSNGRPVSGGDLVIIGMACGLLVLIGLFLLGLYVIKLRGRELAPPSAEDGETDNGSQVEHTANEASVIYSTVTRIPMVCTRGEQGTKPTCPSNPTCLCPLHFFSFPPP
ncbi:uncharacterized protein ACDP82_019012 [Pangshura tecta]